MNNHINTVKLPSHIQYVLSNLFKEIDIYDYLKEDAWIAGGFPRIISRNIHTNAAKTLEDICKYFYSLGDIDIFSKEKDKVTGITNKISNEIQEIREKIMMDGFYINRISQVIQDVNSFSLPFTFNYEKNLNVLEKICQNNNVNFINSLKHKRSEFSVIQTQFVNKFIFKNIRECFDNFDFSNSKIAISFNNNEYYLHYTDLSEFYNVRHLLNIEKVESPFLSNRILKYTKKYNFNIDDNKNFRNQIKDYLYKVIQDNWPEVYGDKFNLSHAVKSLHANIILDKTDLCLFLGMFTHINKAKSSESGYGIFENTIVEVDWAAHEMRRKNGK